jgi:Ca-activated chloride channel family protein
LTLARTLERRGGYRVGLIAFADRAALLCPLTTDFRHFYEEVEHATVENLRLHHDGIVSQDGTAIVGGLARAERALPKAKPDADDKKTYCDILVVSDGGDELDDQTTKVAAALTEKKVRVFTVGVGDSTKTSPIPVQGPTGRRTLLTFQGEVVQTKLEETLLREVARTTSAAYIAAGVQPLPVDQLIPLLESEPTRELNATGQIKDPIQRYEWFLLPAVLLLIGESVISTRRRLPKSSGSALPSKPPWLVRLIPPPRRPIRGVVNKKQEVIR